MKQHGHFSILRKRSSLATLVRSTFTAAIFFTAAVSLSAADATNAYTQWIKPWSERPVTSPALAGAGLKLMVSLVKGEADAAAVAAMTPLQRLDLAFHIQVSTAEVATNGSLRSYNVSNSDAKTSTVRRLAPEDFQLLDALLDRLPDDHAQLPPAGRRVIVQFLSSGQWQIRVYDGNQLPPEVQDLLSLLAKPYDKLF
jgi:hypothetical protein